jgi:predicted ATPase/class 3 adenylate cyclase
MRADLPAGTVTFLFTDVEGSTKLLHELGAEAYAERLAEHRRVVRQACSARAGIEVDTQGDAFFVAFPTPQGALEAAQAINEELASGRIALRIGLHTGTPLLTEEGYVGEDVHFAARVAASAHGGQVVLSQATRALLDEHHPLVELGEHRLKDIPEPVAIYQLGEGQFPPLKTISNTNLPRPASSFVGRERELSGVLARIEGGARLLTLTGPGGSGKTRLALEAAAALVPEYKAGVFWVGLASLRDPALVAETIAQTLGAKEGLVEHIGERELLLLLDNLEQVIEAAPELSSLLQGCRNLTLLVTSRELLRVQGEIEYPVLPLADAEAVSLFCERAQTGATEEIAELCRRLDNLPLAIELAAARAKALSPAQLLERLSQRLDLLKGGRDTDARQQTLRATIAWSYELLSADEQRLFWRLSVFAGGCTLEAAEEVAAADLDTLQSLVEKSLLRLTNERYWMLETIREYAAERLEQAGEAPKVRRRRAMFFADRGVEAGAGLKGPEQEAWLQRVEAERDNLLVSLGELDPVHDAARMFRFAGYGVYFFLRGGLRHLLDALEEALRYSDADSDDRLKATYVAAACAMALGRLDTASELAPDLLAQARRSAEREDLSRALDVNVSVAIELNRTDEARAFLDESLSLARDLGNPVRLADAFNKAATLTLNAGEWEAAITACEEALALRADLPDSHVGLTLTSLAFGLAMKNEHWEALDACEESLELQSHLADAVGVACVLVPIAYITVSSDPAGAGAVIRAAAELARTHGYAFDRFEQSVYDQTSDLVAELIGRDVRDTPLRGVNLESAVELGRQATLQVRTYRPQ